MQSCWDKPAKESQDIRKHTAVTLPAVQTRQYYVVLPIEAAANND